MKKKIFPKKNLTLWDTKGIESKDYNETIAQLKKDLHDGFEHAWKSDNVDDAPHIIWLCIKEGSSRVEGRELALLELAKSLEVPTIIVFTDTQYDKGDEAVELMKEEFNRHYSDFIKGFVRINSVSYSQTIAGQKINFPISGLDKLLEKTGEWLDAGRKNALFRIQVIDKNKRLEANRQQLEEMKAKADTIIHTASTGAAALGASPIPFSDAPLIATAQVGMIYSLNSAFKVDMEDNLATSLVTGALAATAVGQIGRTC